MRPFTLDPFTIDIPQADIDDLHRRLDATRWPEAETVDDWSQGIPLTYVKELADYWRHSYDWRSREARMNLFDQFITEIDNLSIHFIHQRSPEPNAMPLLITHGWPGSIVEFLDVISPLTDPVAHGGKAEDAFHVVCPSLPGYGFSGKPTSNGTGVPKIAALWATLMERLGYERWVAQGGDWGSAVTTQIGRDASSQPDHGCIGIHVNMPIAAPTEKAKSDPDEDDQEAFAALGYYQRWDSGYSKQQATRPQTLGYSLVDSPIGQLAWIIEKFWAWTD
ncbi:MAG: epoxide hydrolase, partial [Actinomycetota bacterium]|nr:epoxide hydrolase [Actinomycetota bacterium]